MAEIQRDGLIQVRFFTKLEEYKVDDVNFSIPLRLNRKDLGELINSLLQKDPPVNFDFLIKGEFLRTNLQKYIEQHRISTELTLDIEYVLSIPLPTPSEDNKGPDWMMSVAGGHPNFVVSGCANGTVQLWGTTDKEVTISSSDFKGSVTSVAWAIPYKESKQNIVIAGSKDNTIRSYIITEDNSWKPMSLFTGHKNSVECVASDPRAVMFCSGGWDSMIYLWSYEDTESDAKDNEGAKKKRKKQSGFTENTHVASMEGHKQGVSAISWATTETIFSGSWDHTIGMWDVQTGVQQRTLSGNHPVYHLDYSTTGLLASTHQDKTIRIWDTRVTEGAVNKQSFTRHQGMVSDVKWSPFSQTHFVSSGYDGKVYLWDLRSNMPLHLLCKHEDKATCVSWIGPQAVSSGGSDGIIKFTRW